MQQGQEIHLIKSQFLLQMRCIINLQFRNKTYQGFDQMLKHELLYRLKESFQGSEM